MRNAVEAVAVGLGWLIAYVDSRPTWDDTAITILAILIICGALGLAEPQRPWRWSLAVAVWVPLVEIPLTGQFASLAVLPVALIGACAGMVVRGILWPPRNG